MGHHRKGAIIANPRACDHERSLVPRRGPGYGRDMQKRNPSQMRQGPSRRGFVAGMLAALPLIIAVVPFGLIFGALAREAGLDLPQAIAFAGLVAAGAAQLVALEMLDQGAPAAVAVFAGAVVNLRMAMYSAAMVPHWRGASGAFRVVGAYFLHDQSFAMTMRRKDDRPDEPLADRLGFYLGTGIFTVSIWMTAAVTGAVIGAQIPEGWGLGFAVPVCFLALVAPMIRGAAHIAAASVAAALAILAAGLPWNLGILIAAAGGIATGVIVERRMAG